MTTAELAHDVALHGEGLPEWMSNGACATPEHRGLPWTTDTDALPDVVIDMMREVCATCPVRLACAGYAMSQAVTGGWWAGTDRDPAVDVMAKFAEDVQLVGDTVQQLLPFDMPAKGAA